MGVLSAQDSRSGCLPHSPAATVSGSLISVMSGAKEGSLEHQVVGDPETVAGGFTQQLRQSLRSNSQRVLTAFPQTSSCSHPLHAVLTLDRMLIVCECLMSPSDIHTVSMLSDGNAGVVMIFAMW